MLERPPPIYYFTPIFFNQNAFILVILPHWSFRGFMAHLATSLWCEYNRSSFELQHKHVPPMLHYCSVYAKEKRDLTQSSSNKTAPSILDRIPRRNSPMTTADPWLYCLRVLWVTTHSYRYRSNHNAWVGRTGSQKNTVDTDAPNHRDSSSYDVRVEGWIDIPPTCQPVLSTQLVFRQPATWSGIILYLNPINMHHR